MSLILLPHSQYQSDVKMFLSTLLLLLGVLFICACGTSGNEQSEEGNTSIDVILKEGTNMAIALSPDKQNLALDLQGTIWVMPVSGGTAQAITDEMGDCHEPAWSPDGESIAFHSYKEGNYHIWIVKKDGSGLRQVTSGLYDDREPDWMSSGDTIVFSSDRNGNYDIWKVSLRTLELTPITEDAANDYNPAVSSQTHQIAFVSEREDAPGIYLSIQGENKLIAPSSMKLAAPSWNTEGDKLIFTAYDGKESHLYMAVTDNQEAELVSSTHEDIFPFRAAWLSDSIFLYTADGKIKKRKLEAEGFEQIDFQASVTLNRPAYERKKYDFDDQSAHTPLGIMNPVVSPEGNRVAFTALGDIYIQEIGGKIIQLTDDKFADIDPDWSPDGQSLVFASDRGGKMDLWITDISTRESRQLTDIEDMALAPSFSPDGKKVAFHATDARNVWGRSTLSILDMASGKIEEIHDPLFVPSKPSWAPDGKTIALMALQAASSRYREGFSKILLISLQGAGERYIAPVTDRTPGMRGMNGPLWSPDGNTMAYIQDGILWTVPVDGEGNITGEPMQLTNELAAKPSWTADSKSIVYMATDHLRKINLENGQQEDISIDLEWTPQLSTESYIIHAGKLFNGLDSTYQENVDILVEGHRIKEVIPHQEHSTSKVIDASDKVVMPGLFEMHTHQHSSIGERLGRIWLANGITSVREPGADPYDALQRKEAWASGKQIGPREFFTGGLTDGGRVYYGLANSVIHGPHMQLELERAKKLGYDLIKTYVRLPDSIQKEITTAAHAMGIPVSSHEIYPAMKYNVDAVEHIRGTSRRGYSLKQSELNKTYGDVIQLLASSGMNITPTIGLQGGFFLMLEKDPDLLANRQLNALYSTNYIGELSQTITRFRRIRPGFGANFEDIQQAVTSIVKAGGHLTAGTDSPFIPYGTSLHVELQLFVEGGLTPFQALQSATIKSAKAVGVDADLGSIEAGKLADLIIVEGDPLHQIKDSWNVVTVFKNGIKYEVEDLLQDLRTEKLRNIQE